MRFLIFVAILVFLGCSNKQDSGYFEPTKYQQQSIIHTKRDEFTINKTRYLVMSTYISSIQSEILNKNQEEFLVSVYKNQTNKDEITFSNITLNKDTYSIKVQKLDKNDKRLKFAPILNSWSEYFLITTPLKDSPILHLSFEIDHSHKVSLTFPKEL